MVKQYNPLVKVGSTYLPESSEYKTNTATMVDGGRNLQGKMIGSVIRDDVAKVTLSWNYLTVKQWRDILKLFKVGRGGRFVNTVTYFDQTEGAYVTRNMYVSDRNAGLFRRDPDTGEVLGWLGCGLSLIEV